MKHRRLPPLLRFSLVLAFLSAGCATDKRPTVDTWHDPQFSPTHTSTIALTDRPHCSRQDAELTRLLVTDLKQDGFEVASPAQADYLIAVVLDVADTKQHDTVYQYRYNINPMFPGPSIRPETPLPEEMISGDPALNPNHTVTYHFIKKYIRLYLYTNPKTHAGNLQVAWQGNIEVKPSGPAADEPVLLKTLLSHFGKDYSGRVNLTPWRGVGLLNSY